MWLHQALLDQNSTRLSILSLAGWLMVSLLAYTAVTDVHLLHLFLLLPLQPDAFQQIPQSYPCILVKQFTDQQVSAVRVSGTMFWRSSALRDVKAVVVT